MPSVVSCTPFTGAKDRMDQIQLIWDKTLMRTTSTMLATFNQTALPAPGQ